jgi:hypothetical protein
LVALILGGVYALNSGDYKIHGHDLSELPSGTLVGYCMRPNWEYRPNFVMPVEFQALFKSPAHIMVTGTANGLDKYECVCDPGFSPRVTGMGYQYTEWDLLYYSCMKV